MAQITVSAWLHVSDENTCVYIQQQPQPGELATSRLVAIRLAVLNDLIIWVDHYTTIQKKYSAYSVNMRLSCHGYHSIDVNLNGEIRLTAGAKTLELAYFSQECSKPVSKIEATYDGSFHTMLLSIQAELANHALPTPMELNKTTDSVEMKELNKWFDLFENENDIH